MKSFVLFQDEQVRYSFCCDKWQGVSYTDPEEVAETGTDEGGPEIR